MTAVQLNAMNTQLWQNIGAIADDESLMKRLSRYVARLVKALEDQALQPRLTLPPQGIDLEADVVLAKGQGNYESLCRQGRHIFYSFLCKCELFTQRFQVPKFSGVFAEEWK